MKYVFPIAQTPSVEVVGEDARFPVRRIFCVGRNYRDHAKEMGVDPDREPPFFFTKPADAVVAGGESVGYPRQTKNFHFEGELVLAIGKAGRSIQAEHALVHIYGYAVGNDLTRRDLQLQAREKGRPWDWGKAFDRSAVCGPIYKVESVGHIERGSIETRVNGQPKQSADVADMIWGTADIISFLSASIDIQPGDLVFTGTPAGVGALVPGDTCIVSIEKLGQIATLITE